MNKTWTDQDALDLIEKVEGMFMTHLADMKPLAKSEESEEDKKDDKKDEKDESKKDESKAEEMVMKTEQPAEQAAGSEDTVESLYKSMSPEEQKAHYEAIKKAMAGEVMNKSEEGKASKEEPKNDDETSLLKSEVAALKAANEELKKNQESIVAALAKKFAPKQTTAPKQKAITELGALNKSETKDVSSEMSDAQVRKALGEKAKDPTLKKSDRDLINAYCYNKVDVSAVKHLIG